MGSLPGMATTPSPPLRRVLTAMVTPFDAEGRLDLDAAGALAEHLVDRGVEGLVLSGTTGESPTTTGEEKERLLRTVVDAVGGRAVVIAGVGTYDTAHSVELAQQAEKAGAQGLLVVAPYYSKPPQEGLLRHFTTVADATALPVMLYDIPGRTGVAIGTETLVRIADHERVVAVKDAKGDLYASSWVLARTDLDYYSGDDALNLAHLTQGAVGVVSVIAHVVPGECASLVRAVVDGDLPTGIGLHRRLLPVVRGVMTRTQGVIMAKAGLQLLGLLEHRTVRLPLVEATDDEVALLRGDLAESGLLAA